MNGLVKSGEESEGSGKGSVASDHSLERVPMLSDSFGVAGRDTAFRLPLGGGGKPMGKVELEDPERGLCQKCGEEASG